MKKLLCTLTALTCIASFTACGSSSSSSENSSKSEASTAILTETADTTMNQTEATESISKTETVTSTELETTVETTVEPTTAEESTIDSSSDYVDLIGKSIDITNVTKMAAEMIGAEEGTSFKYNGNKFEIYRFKADDPKIEQAKSGSLTYTIEGFGEFTSKSSVNGNYVMIYDTPEDKVIEAFEKIS